MRLCLFMVGPSGSGKSTRAKWYIDKYAGTSVIVEVFSTDDQFIDHGVYKWEAKKLGYAHRKNEELVEAAMKKYREKESTHVQQEIELASIWGQTPTVGHVVVVDNTNLKRRDRRPYEELAVKYGYETHTEVVGPTTKADLVKYAARNIHGLTLAQVLKQATKMDVAYPKTTES